MQSTMGRGIAAGAALALFVIAFVTFALGGDRIAIAAALAGMVALSVAILAHVVDPPRP